MSESMLTSKNDGSNACADENTGRLTPELDQLSVVDDLQPVKPTKKYFEYVDDFETSLTGNPDYKFRIKELSELIEGETEVRGRTFLLPGYHVLAQITCTVKFESFWISITFLNPEMHEKPAKWRINPRIAFFMPQNDSSTSEGKWFHHKFAHEYEIAYGKSYLMFHLNYKEEIEKSAHQNSITLHLFVEKSDPTKDVHVSDGLFLWKPYFNEMKLDEDRGRDLAVSPYFYTEPEGLRVKIRLYFQENYANVEVRFLDENDFQNECTVRITVTDQSQPSLRERPNKPTSFCKRQPPRLKSSWSGYLVSKSTILELAKNNKLLVKVQLEYS